MTNNDGIVATVENEHGRRFNVRAVPTGARYGLSDKLVNAGAAMIEFYDAKYENAPGFGPRGQFVQRYYLATLTGADGHGSALASGRGLDLHGGVDAWKINHTNLCDAIASCERALKGAV